MSDINSSKFLDEKNDNIINEGKINQLSLQVKNSNQEISSSGSLKKDYSPH